MADRAGGPNMSAYRKFDTYKDLAPETPAKIAKVAKEDTETLASLATLAARPAENANSFRSIASLRGDEDGSRRPLAVSLCLTDIPTDWALCLRSIAEKPCPMMIEPKRWLQLQKDANRFVDLWGRQAAALGWSSLDIFGCHPLRRSDRYDCMGLIWMVTGADLQAMGSRVAALRTPSGRLITVSKSADVQERILIWGLTPGGPDSSGTPP